MSSNSPNITKLIENFRASTEHFVNIAKSPESPWTTNLNDPTLNDPRKLHNAYARNLFTCYVSKFADLSAGILLAVEHSNFLMYALCGRALIETMAILRYYIVEEYKPLLDKGPLGQSDLLKLIEIDDRHLRGGSFDWESFVFENYSKLKEEAVARVGGRPKRPGREPRQVRIGRDCMRSWAKETPVVSSVYDLFCDLVHPNIGSTFLVASTTKDGLYFSRFRGKPVGHSIFEQSFPMLVSVTHKEFGKYLTLLAATVWRDDELSVNDGDNDPVSSTLGKSP